ncbi:putative laminarinase [Pterulicium gracile]|uniref:Putative laminarinase n=1 Tax=Pterulicium gracile TaxID=1884261 RepID=A0A5C3QEX8_9AGAR|nr:putative laminarinase [Pterula gracilis]
MYHSRAALFLTQAAAILPFCLGATYSRTSHVVGHSFYDNFFWEDAPDPTHGRVNYLNKETSRALNITYASEDSFFIQADATTTLTPWGPGRNSARIVSKKSYTTHVAVFDVKHMPEGCGTWPAIWETSLGPWPAGGEVDLLEGVNNQTPNTYVMHTSPYCMMPPGRPMSGISTSDNCDVFSTGFSGCGTRDTRLNSFGPPFNANGGGWYALERAGTFKKIWFWPRDDPSVPADVVSGGAAVNTDSWGLPAAYYPDDLCDFATHFAEHNIVINLTFCGDWGGNAYPGSGCPSTCFDFVNDNPASFGNAYFDIKSVNVYE